MGEAKRRGSFEQRMTEAIAYGRKRKPKVEREKVDPYSPANLPFMAAINAMHSIAFNRLRGRRRK